MYRACADYVPASDDLNSVQLTNGQKVELIGINQHTGWWWVRALSLEESAVEGWVPACFLELLNNSV